MKRPDEPADRVCDVLVAGSGLTGLTAAIAFARLGFDVVSCGASERTGRGRTVALLDRSAAYLKSLGLWEAIAPEAAALRGLRLIDDARAFFPPRPVEFVSSEIGLEAFGWNVENDRLSAALAAGAAQTPGLERLSSPVAGYHFSPEKALARLEDGRKIEARLVVGADGRASLARRAARLKARAHRYPQSALTALLWHRLAHDDFSTEFHTREGPFTLVPLRGNVSAPNRSSLVWVMSPGAARRRAALERDRLAEEIERQAHSILGAMRVEGEPGLFPVASETVPKITNLRLALVGDAAHGLPPIGAQGLNLGLRDVETIVGSARYARALDDDIGGREALRRYERSRRFDIAARTTLVDGLNRALLSRLPPVDFARGAGLAALGAIGPLRRFVMRGAMGPGFPSRA
jgi:2-octaprenyl-6-methoxyphenol hydroxylase